MSGLGLLLILFSLVAGGNSSQLHLQASLVSEPEDRVQSVILECRESANGQAIAAEENDLSRLPDELTRCKENCDVLFKLNGSVIEENTSSLIDYKVHALNDHKLPFVYSYTAQFQLPTLERFMGTFSCERNISNNISVSNELVLVYQQLEPFFKGITKATLWAVFITITLLWIITTIALVLSCLVNYKQQRTLKRNRMSRSTYNLADPPLSRNTIQHCPHWDGCKTQSQPNCKNTTSNNLPFTFSENASLSNEMPASLKVSYQYNVDAMPLGISSKQSSDNDSVCSLYLGNERLSSSVVSRSHQLGSIQKVKTQGKKNPLHASLLPCEKLQPKLLCQDLDNLDRMSYPHIEPTDIGRVNNNQSLIIDATTVTFNSEGRVYTNKQHGISLKIPSGAIPHGKTITIEIGVFLNSPFLIPSDSIPISPIVKLCVVGDPYFRFLKPIEVKLPHCMDIVSKEDVRQFDVKFVKAQHNQFCFHDTDGKAVFEPQMDFATLKTEHFCSYCIIANKKLVDVTKIKYRFTKVIPRDTATPTKRWCAYFCVTYFLPTCYRVLENQFNSQDYKLHSLDIFTFATGASSSDACIEIEFERTLSGGWNLNLESPRNEIYAKEIEFWGNDSEFLHQKEKEGLYPPRFILEVSGVHAQKSTHTTVWFKGASKPIKVDLLLEKCESGHYYNIPFHFQPSLTTSPSSWSVPDNVRLNTVAHHAPHRPRTLPSDSLHSSEESLTGEPSFKDLMDNVAAVIPTEWRTVGIQLGLEPAQLHEIAANNPSNSTQCFMAVFEVWRRHDSTGPSFQWSTLISALQAPSVDQIRLAKTLRNKFMDPDTETDNQLE